MKKETTNPIIVTVIGSAIIAIAGFVVSTEVSKAVVTEKLRAVDVYFEMIIKRLDRIENKLDTKE